MSKSRFTNPFPQANNLSLALNVFRHIGRNKSSKPKDIANTFGLSHRQGNYYVSALAWLGLVELDSDSYRLTVEGQHVYRLTTSQKMHYISRLIVANPVFSKVFASKRVTKTDMRKAKMHKLSETTQLRRISTASSWRQTLANYNAVAIAS